MCHRCGGPIHPAPEGVDKEPVCLMHSRDLQKSDEEFQKEFKRILKEAGTGIADFSGVVFPAANYPRRTFAAQCVFSNATFTQGADFSWATFIRDASFFHATFTQKAVFEWAKFRQNAHFSEATFTQNAHFSEATFTQDASFLLAKFTQDAGFTKATFTQDAGFGGATFTQKAYFGGAEFSQDAGFSLATFTQDVDFSGATFTQLADFSRATFTQHASFSGATFTQDAQFGRAKFTQDVDFSLATFTMLADFRVGKFLGPVAFRETKFRRDSQRAPGLVFSLAEFSRPEVVVFYKTYLGQAVFHNCDASKFVFSSVEWRERKGSRKRIVFEEDVDLKHSAAEALRPQENNPDERDYGLIAELYQQLKKNYDDRKDYWTGGDFHYGEMEMKRLATPRAGRIARWASTLNLRTRHHTIRALGRIGFDKKRIKRFTQWLPARIGLTENLVNHLRRSWHQRLSLVAWYKYASHYGESYTRPGFLLVGVLFAFALVYPAVGLRYDASKEPLPAALSPQRPQTHPPHHERARPKKPCRAAATRARSSPTALQTNQAS